VTEAIAYLNGQLIAASRAAISLVDAGFVLGATVTEQLRTFRGELFRLPEHLERLKHSLEIVGIQPRESLTDIAEIAQRIARHNFALVAPGDDLGLCIFTTPGGYVAMAEEQVGTPTVGLHSYRLPFHLWAEKYDNGVALVTTPIQQVPADCWPAELKCRSRMHYYLADQQAARVEAGARALLLDHEGFVSETSTANVVAHFPNEGLVSPPRSQVLPGISLQVLIELAGRLGISFVERQIREGDLATADELMLTSTPNCILPVARLNGRQIGKQPAGPIFTQLLRAWNEMAGFDIAAQARRFTSR
jgi:branched-chain amino acid aminotransferase